MTNETKIASFLDENLLSSTTLDESLAVVAKGIADDEMDDLLATVASCLIDLGRFDEAELVVARISRDWASIASELFASLAEARSELAGGSPRPLLLLVRALRLTSDCDEWKWVEAESMARVASAAASIGQLELARAIYLEAATEATLEANKSLGERSIDATKVISSIARALSAIGFREDALKIVELIGSPEKRTQTLGMLET